MLQQIRYLDAVVFNLHHLSFNLLIQCNHHKMLLKNLSVFLLNDVVEMVNGATKLYFSLHVLPSMTSVVFTSHTVLIDDLLVSRFDTIELFL